MHGKLNCGFLFPALFLLFSCTTQKIQYGEWQLVANGFEFPEGPAWNEQKNSLYVSNCYGNWLAAVKQGKIDSLLVGRDSTFQKTNGLVYSSSGKIYACDFGLGAILEINLDGVSSVLIPGFDGQPFNRPNDLTIFKNRQLYFTDPKSYGTDKPDGRVFSYNLDSGQMRLELDSLCFPNGIAVSPDNQQLFVCESARNRILRFQINTFGQLTEKEVFIELPGGDPDGIDFDVKGNLYVAHFGGGMLYIISPTGDILHVIKTPGQKPTNVEFGGEDFKTLFLTEVETNSVYSMRVSISGLTVN